MDLITHPISNIAYSVYSNEGKTLLKHYVKLLQTMQSGGSGGRAGGGGGGGASRTETGQALPRGASAKNTDKDDLREKLTYVGMAYNRGKDYRPPVVLEHVKPYLKKTGTHPPSTRKSLGDHLKISTFNGAGQKIYKIPLTSSVYDLQREIFDYMDENETVEQISRMKGAIIGVEGINIHDGKGKALNHDVILNTHFNSGDNVNISYTVENHPRPYIDDIITLINHYMRKDIDAGNYQLVLYIIENISRSDPRLSIPIWAKFYERYYWIKKTGIINDKYVSELFAENKDFWDTFKECYKEYEE